MRLTETIKSGDTDNVVNNVLNDSFTNRLFQQTRCFSDNSSQFQSTPQVLARIGEEEDNSMMNLMPIPESLPSTDFMNKENYLQ